MQLKKNYTRIVCTIGPKSLEEEMLLSLHNQGMSMARLNGSHADLEWHHNAIKKIQKILPSVPILLDIPGRKIRTLQLIHEPSFEVGDILILTTDTKQDGLEKVPVNYPDLHNDVKEGNVIMADDGTLRFSVIKVSGRDIYCCAEVSGQLKSRKGINVPFVSLNTPQVTARDEQMIAFARENKVDFIGLSFVESADHVNAFRTLINGSSPRIIAKIENQGGLDRVFEIAEAADAIMIDRGDLSVETSLYDIAIKQKHIISAAQKNGRPVIVATEMLHTMIQNPVPTKSEVCDISNAVLDGCSATMLSGETAMGAFPLEALSTMRQVISATESHQKNTKHVDNLLKVSVPEAVSIAIPSLCRSLPITKIIAITRSGYAARMLAVHRLQQPILAVSDDQMASRSFNLIAGTIGIYSKTPFLKNSTDHIVNVMRSLFFEGHINEADLVVVTGVSFPAHGTRMNTIQVHSIGDLVKIYNWSIPTQI